MSTLKKYSCFLRNLSCANCASRIEGMISQEEGFSNVSLNFNTSKLSFESNRPDYEEKMLEIIKKKIRGLPIENTIVLYKCTQNQIGIIEKVDFVLMFYMVHEVPNKNNFFNEILPLINKNGLLMIIEPSWISKNKFNDMIKTIKEKGFEEHSKPRITMSKAIVLKKE